MAVMIAISEDPGLEAGLLCLEPYLRAFLRRRLCGDVDDAVQETLLRGLAGRQRLSNPHSLRAFLVGVAWHVSLETYRDHRRHGVCPLEDDASSNARRVDDLLDTERWVGALRLHMRDLPEALRQALEMYYWESLTAPEIGVRLGIPEPTVRSRLRRGRERLRRALASIFGGFEP